MPGDLHNLLVKKAAKWAIRSERCTWVLLEPHSTCLEMPDVIGWSLSGMSVLVECKASRADFLSDKHKSCRRMPWEMGMGQRRWYCTAPSVVKSIDEIPERWGWIELQNHGRFQNRKFADLVTEINPDIQRREFQVLLPALRKAHGGYGNVPWLMFNPQDLR